MNFPEEYSICFEELILVERGYVNNPYDSGGKTKYGITERLARHHGYTGDMKNLSLEFAKLIYKKEFWDVLSLDDISKLSFKTANELFESSVNIGYGTIAKNFQQCINLLNLQAKIYRDIIVDGDVGPSTIAAFKAHLLHRKSDIVIVKMLNCLQGAYYIDLATRREKDENFVYGWFNDRVVI